MRGLDLGLLGSEDTGYPGAPPGAAHGLGVAVDENGAPLQALRRVNGELLTEQAAHAYLSGQAAHSGMPLSSDQVNVVGVRGLQGGDAHDNAGVWSNENTYNDTFFLLSTDEEGGQHVQPFRGTTDPGGDSGGFQVESNQQWDYNLRTMADSTKLERPVLWPGMSNVRDPSRADGQPHDLRVAERPVEDPEHPGQFTQGHHEQSAFMAHHSGTSGGTSRQQVKGDSMGCQVVHGDWFPSYLESVRRAMDDDHTDNRDPQSGTIRYTLLDSETMDRPPPRP